MKRQGRSCLRPLIDGDILNHELGWSGEFNDYDSGESVLLSSDHVLDLLDEKIRLICEDVYATEPPTIYFSSSEEIVERLNKFRRWQGEDEIEFVPNFRYEVAKTKPYKGTRKNPKPFHFYNLLFYMMSEYDWVLSEGGLEADDMMCIEQMSSPKGTTIICSRDKDLRICPGWHFSWECGSQRAIGPVETDEVGWLELEVVERKSATTGKVTRENKLTGYGLSFFYAQMLTGDTADNIPGLPKYGPKKAFELLSHLKTKEDLLKTVKDHYKMVMGKEKSKDFFLEQGTLLWMVQRKGEMFRV